MSDGMFWLCRVLRLGSPCRDAHTLIFPRQVGPELAAALIGAPVRSSMANGRLSHPPADRDTDVFDPAYFVGMVVDAWLEAASAYATVELAGRAVVLRQGLRAMEADGVLARSVAVSLVARVLGVPRDVMGREMVSVTKVRSVIALDLVSSPGAADGAAVLRSLAAPILHHEGVFA